QYVVTVAIDGPPGVHRDVPVRRGVRVGAAGDFQTANDSPAVQVLVVITKIGFEAQLIERILHGSYARHFASTHVADIVRANGGQAGKLLAAVIDHPQTGVDLEQRKLAVMMLHSQRRLGNRIGVWHVVGRPLDFSRSRARWNLPVGTRGIASVEELNLNARFDVDPPGGDRNTGRRDARSRHVPAA